MIIIKNKKFIISIFILTIFLISPINGEIVDDSNLLEGKTIIESDEINWLSSGIILSDDLYTNNASDSFKVKLVDEKNNSLANKPINFKINDVEYNKITNQEGIAILNINLNQGFYKITSQHEKASVVNNIIIRDSSTIFILDGSSNAEIQKLIDNAAEGSTIEFVGGKYENISLIITKQLNIVSYLGSLLSGVNNKDVLTFSNVDNCKVFGLNISNGLNGILINGGSNIHIFANTILNNKENGIKLQNANNLIIEGNTISNNYNGIYFDDKNKNISVLDNHIAFNKKYGIHFAKTSLDVKILRNIIEKNEYGINISSKVDGLVIKNNAITTNHQDGINVGPGYRKTDDNKDFILEHNVIMDNGNFNVRARDSIYEDGIKLGENYLGTPEQAFAKWCPRVSMELMSLHAEQDGDKITFQLGEEYKAVPIFYQKIIVNGEIMYVPFTNGSATVVIPNFNPDGGIVNWSVEDNTTHELETIPYQKPVDDLKPNPQNPQNPQTNQTLPSNLGGGGGDPTSNSQVSGQLSISGDLISSLGIAGSSEPSASGASSPTPVSSETEKEKVVKKISINEEIIRVAGIGMLIILIIIAILGYYGNDVREMFLRRKNSQ